MQIVCRAPTDCTQYFTGVTGTVKSYNFGGGQMLQAQTYQNCIRTEKGYCAIQWKQSSTTSPDPFQVGTYTPSAGSSACTGGFIFIPNLSPDGINGIPVPPGISGFQSGMCGILFGIEGMTGTITQALVSKYQHQRCIVKHLNILI